MKKNLLVAKLDENIYLATTWSIEEIRGFLRPDEYFYLIDINSIGWWKKLKGYCLARVIKEENFDYRVVEHKKNIKTGAFGTYHFDYYDLNNFEYEVYKYQSLVPFLQKEIHIRGGYPLLFDLTEVEEMLNEDYEDYEEI